MVEQKVKDAVKTLLRYGHDIENKCEECKQLNMSSIEQRKALVLKVKKLEKENEGLKSRNFVLTAQIKMNITTYQALFPEEIKPKPPTICPHGYKFGIDWEDNTICFTCDLNSQCEERDV